MMRFINWLPPVHPLLGSSWQPRRVPWPAVQGTLLKRLYCWKYYIGPPSPLTSPSPLLSTLQALTIPLSVHRGYAYMYTSSLQTVISWLIGRCLTTESHWLAGMDFRNLVIWTLYFIISSLLFLGWEYLGNPRWRSQLHEVSYKIVPRPKLRMPDSLSKCVLLYHNENVNHYFPFFSGELVGGF